MRNIIFVIILTFVTSCSTYNSQPVDTYSKYDDYEPRVMPEQQYGEEYTQYNEIVKRYEQQPALENKKSRIFNTIISAKTPVKVAVLLPLSGKYKSLGDSLLDAAQLALFGINDPNLVLMPIDTKGDSFGAFEAAKKAISQGAKVIVGPVFSSSAKAIAEIAAENNVNVISFSNNKALAGTGVFALGFLPEQQIKRVVQYAMSIGIEDFTAVLPNSSYGASAAKEIRETVATNPAGSVLKTEIFRTSKDGKALRLSKHVYSAFDSAKNTKPPKDFDEEQGKFNFNVIKYPRGMVIAEGGQNLKDTASYLKRFKFKPSMIQLLGDAQWYDKSLLENDILQGALFATPLKNRRENFENNFMSVYGYPSNRISSLAYDAVALVAAVARISGQTNFTREQLTNPRGFIGVDGIFRLKEDGLTERGLAIMGIVDGEFVVVDPAPKSFFEYDQQSLN